MLVGILVAGVCTWACGKYAINCFLHKHDGAGWVCLFGSSFNFALVLKYMSEVV